MKRKRLLFLGLLLPVVGLLWALRSAASWRPQLFGVQKDDATWCILSPDGHLLLASSSGNSGNVNFWDVEKQRRLWGTVADWPVMFSANSQMVALVRGLQKYDSGIRTLKGTHFDMVEARSGRVLRSLGDSNSKDADRDDDICFYGFSSDSHEFRVATSHRLRSWNIDNGKLLTVIRWKPNSQNKFSSVLHGQFSTDGKTLFAGLSSNGSRTIGVFDVGTAQLLRVLPVGVDASDFDVSPDGYSIWTEDNNQVKSFRISDGKSLWPSSVFPIFSFDGKTAYVRGKRGIDVFDAHTGRKWNHLSGLGENVFTLSPNGNWLYEARDGKIWKWRAR